MMHFNLNTIFYAGILSALVATIAGCPNDGYYLSANYTKQYIRSPNYPDYYPRPSSCKWTLEATQGDIIVFQFYHFETEASIFCYKDSISIIDGHTGFHYELLSMCGSYDKTSDLHKTSEPAAIISFTAVTDGDQETGFEIAFWTADILDPDFRDPEYNVVNYILLGVSVVIALITVYGMYLLWKVHVRLKIRILKQDQDMTERRIQQCYYGASIVPLIRVQTEDD